MTVTEEQEQEQQQQQQTSTASRWGPRFGENGQGTRVDGSVRQRLADAGVDFDGESGNSNFPRFTDHYDGQEVSYKNKSNQIQNNCPPLIADRADWLDKVEMALSGR